MSVLSVKDLCITFGGGAFKAANGLNFDVFKDETLCIIGESGSGKSTTAFSLLGLLPKSAGVSGEITYQGENLLTLSENDFLKVRGKKIAMIFQEPMTSLNPVMTVGNQIAEALILHNGLSGRDALKEAKNLLDVVKIPDPDTRISQYPHQLSGGMRQRVMIAMALACSPDVLIADEPTTALDVTIQAEILELLKTIRRDRGLSVVFITHDLGVVAQIADRVAVMYKGEIVEIGDARQIFNKPVHDYTRTLLAAALRVDTASVEPTKAPAADMLLEVKDLTKVFKVPSKKLFGKPKEVRAVDGISFSIAKGETLGVVGESGCGKSTLSRCILNLIKPTTGRIIYDGTDITEQSDKNWRELRKKFQIVFQDPYSSLNPRLAIGQTLAEPLLVHDGVNYANAHPKLVQLMNEVGLPAEALDRYPHEFSGGQRQRVVIARALVLEPELIIADEAVSALDVTIRAQILKLLRDVQDRRGLSFMFITHDLGVLRDFCDRALVMYKGQMVEQGSVGDLLDNPQHEYTKILRNAAPVPEVA